MKNSEPQSVGVIISTYNSPEWLRKVLLGYACQSRRADRIVIADDGSRDDTRAMIEEMDARYDLNITHVWHPDDGFQKSRILNKAIVAADGCQYLIFTDQDCIPRADFVEVHVRNAQPGYMVSGGYFKLPLDISHAIEFDDIETGRAFELKWLRRNGLKCNFKCTKLMKCRWLRALLNVVTPAKASWNGCNSSGWRADMLAVNGFNEQMQYGGQDREFGERLANMGIRSRQRRYSAICLHLDHKRPYKTKESVDKNVAIRKNTRRKKIVETPYGINQL